MTFARSCFLLVLTIAIANGQDTSQPLTKRDLNTARDIFRREFDSLSSKSSDIWNQMRQSGTDGSVFVKAWMHNGDEKMNGCGLFLNVVTAQGQQKSGLFPDWRKIRCGNEVFRARITPRGEVINYKVQLDGQQANQVEIHADGHENTYIDTLCIGFNGNTVTGGPRSFCINQGVLRGCQQFMDKFAGKDLSSRDIWLTRSNRATHKIVFREVSTILEGFEKLTKNKDDVDGMYKVCDRIDLVRDGEGDATTCDIQRENQSPVTRSVWGCTTESNNWRLVWSDEFDGNSLDTSKWRYETGAWTINNELQFYTNNRQDNVRVGNGVLTIQAKQENYGGRQYTSGRLLHSGHGWTYGRFESRAKMPKGTHLWPAIWMFPTDSKYGVWAASGEIDIMEFRGNRPTVIEGTLHYGGTSPHNVWTGSGHRDFGIDFSKDFHTFAIEWTPNQIKFFVDNRQYHVENINRSMWSGRGPNPYNKNGQPFDQNFRWVLNLAIGGHFFPENVYGKLTVDKARQWEKATMEIDYVRVYQKQ